MQEDLIFRFESARMTIKGLRMSQDDEIHLAYILRDIDKVINDSEPNTGALEKLIDKLECFTIELPQPIGEQYD